MLAKWNIRAAFFFFGTCCCATVCLYFLLPEVRVVVYLRDILILIMAVQESFIRRIGRNVPRWRPRSKVQGIQDDCSSHGRQRTSTGGGVGFEEMGDDWTWIVCGRLG